MSVIAGTRACETQDILMMLTSWMLLSVRQLFQSHKLTVSTAYEKEVRCIEPPPYSGVHTLLDHSVALAQVLARARAQGCQSSTYYSLQLI